MSKNRASTAVVLVTLFASLLVLSSPSRAFPQAMPRGSVSMRVSPTYIVTEVRDGDFIGPITVSNTGSLPLDFEGIIEEGGHDENGVPVFPGSTNNTLSNGVFLTLEPAKFRLMPGESRSIKVRAHVSHSFSGGAYPIILFRGKPKGERPASELNTSSQVGVLTLITVAPNRKQESMQASANITSVALSQDPQDKSITVSAICENQGNIHTTLSGTAIIRDYHGQPASLTQLTPVVCLPGYKRALTGRFKPKDFTGGIYIAEVLVNAEGNTFPSIPVAFRIADNGIINVIHMDLAHP